MHHMLSLSYLSTHMPMTDKQHTKLKSLNDIPPIYMRKKREKKGRLKQLITMYPSTPFFCGTVVPRSDIVIQDFDLMKVANGIKNSINQSINQSTKGPAPKGYNPANERKKANVNERSVHKGTWI